MKVTGLWGAMLRESLNCLEHSFSQNLDFGDAASEGSKKEFRCMLSKTEKKEDLYYVGAESLATQSFVVVWKAENVPNKMYDLVKNISK